MFKPKKYRIIALREFSTPIEIDGLNVIFGDWNCFGAKHKKPTRTTHVAAIEVRGWFFKKGVAYLFGESATELIEEAKAAGVYSKGDPGTDARDRQVKQPTSYYTSTGCQTWTNTASPNPSWSYHNSTCT